MASISAESWAGQSVDRQDAHPRRFIALTVVMVGAAAVGLAIPRIPREVIEEHLVGEPEHAELGILAAGTLIGD